MRQLVARLSGTLYFQSRWHSLLTERLHVGNKSVHIYRRQPNLQSCTNYGDRCLSKHPGVNIFTPVILLSKAKQFLPQLQSYVHSLTNPNSLDAFDSDTSEEQELWHHGLNSYCTPNVQLPIDPCDNAKQVKQRKSYHPTGGRYMLQDKDWARKAVQKLKKYINFKDPDVTVIECNPAGKLTRSLLIRNQAHVVALNYHKQFTPDLVALQQNVHFKKRFSLTQGNILTIGAILKNLKRDGNQEDGPFSSDCPINILGTTYPRTLYPHYINLLTQDIANREHVYSLGRVQSFFFVPATELQILGHKVLDDKLFNRGSIRSAFYKVFFNYKVLLKVTPEAFGISKKNNGQHEDQNVYLISLVPKDDIYSDICSQNNISGLIFLLRELRRCRGKTLMGFMESFCPQALPLLIEKGFTDSHTVSGLTIEDVIILHKILLTQPDCLAFDQEVEHEDAINIEQ